MPADRIQREIWIAAPVERVWAVLTEAGHLGVWFGQGRPVELELRPGGLLQLDHGPHGTFPARVVAVEAPRYFAYRWATAYPGQETTEDNSTLVEFTLAPQPGGTRLRLVESGFARLAGASSDGHAGNGGSVGPDGSAAPAPDGSSIESHGDGWAEVLAELGRHAESLRT